MGGPFNPNSITLTLTNAGTNSFSWTLVNAADLAERVAHGRHAHAGRRGDSGDSQFDCFGQQPADGSLLHHGLVHELDAAAWRRAGSSRCEWGSRTTTRSSLIPRVNDLAFQTFTFTPDGSASFYSVCRETAASFPTDPPGGTTVTLTDDSYAQVTLSGGNTVAIYNTRTNVLFIGSNGYLTMNSGDTTYASSYTTHFNRPRISGLFRDLNPGAGGAISWKQLSDRVAVTYLAVPVYGSSTLTNSFQFEMFFDGRIRLTCLAIKATDGLAGVSAGTGLPANFAKSDLTSYGSCSAPLFVTVPTTATEGNGVLAGAGQVRLLASLATNLDISLSSSDTNEVTVPPGVTILAGRTNAAFDLTIVDDAELDGTQTATISSWAPGYNAVAVP